MKFQKSTIATVVGVAISTVSLGVAANSINSADAYNASAQSASKLNVYASQQQKHVSSAVTVSGMKNQYDAKLGKTTFNWANVNQARPDMGAIAAEHRAEYAAEFYLNNIAGLSTSKLSSSRAVVRNIHDQGRGAIVAKYKQQVKGIDVFNSEYNVMMDREYGLVASSGYFSSAKSTEAAQGLAQISDAFGQASKAIKSAFVEMGGDANAVDLSEQVADENISSDYAKFSVASQNNNFQLLGQPRAKKVFYDLKGRLIPSYYVEIEAGDKDSVESSYYGYVISSITGEVLFKNNLMSHAADFTYRVYADVDGENKPWDGPHGNVIPAEGPDQVDETEYLDAPLVTLVSGPISTEDPWLADDAQMTVGNNVQAYVDVIAPDGFTNGDYVATTTSANTFDYPYRIEETEYSMHNRKAAIVNLFYMNNYLHDWFYDHGFDEASGNAQMTNYGRGGVEGDPLAAQVQDNSGFNNANMSTPADGGSPRMQMYLWDSKDAVNGEAYGITLTTHPDIGLLDSTQRSGFGQAQFSVSGDLVRIEDAVDPIRDGCEETVNGADVAGKIAVIDRGACNFTQKVKHAQDAGAIAVIVANNRDGDIPAPMGGSDDTVKIPNMGISENEGAEIYALLDADETVSVDMFNDKPFKASSWDNGIVAHEWGHYISNRLVGNSSGLINNQGRSMGEGWGDFHSLLLLANAADSELPGNDMYQRAYAAESYVASFYYGIRAYPYSTDQTVNPLTFKNIEDSAQVHYSGTVWATMLWDVYVALINDGRHTYNEAEHRMMDYLVAGYKMTPIAPTYTEARDAILAAAFANDVEDYNVMLAAFANRGIGLGAVSPDRYSTDHLGVVESDKTELATFTVTDHTLDANYEGLTTGYCSNDDILDKGETGTVSFTIQNAGSEALTGLTGVVEATSGQDVTFANDGVVTFEDLAMFGTAESSTLEFTLNEAVTSDTLELKVTFPDIDEDIETESYSFSTTVNVDFSSRAPIGNASTDDMEDVSTMNDFNEIIMVGGEMAEGTFGLDTTYNWLFPVDQQYLFVSNNGFASDVTFETDAVTVGFAGDFTVSWWQYYEIEETWDGGVVEISVNNGPWADVTAMGGQFEGNGYTGVINEQAGTALVNREAFTGFMPWPGGMETVNFGTGLNGNEVKFRFRIASDTNTNEFGWFVDNVEFSNINTSVFSDVVAGDTYPCDNRLPTVEVEEEQNANNGDTVHLDVEAVDANGDALTYLWTQVSGTAVTLNGADTANASFIAPNPASGSDTLVFNVEVSDGSAGKSAKSDTGSVNRTVTVQVTGTPPVEEPDYTGGSSGGSTGFLTLLLLPLALLRRRK